MPDRATVVIPTVDRSAPLLALLHSLTLQTHDDFEVVIVAGPPHDATLRTLDTFARPIRVVTCPERNLSMARNIGIAAAASDIVAFVDDDAIVEPRWLEELIAPLADTRVAVAGGLVMDHHGTHREYDGLLADRLGRVRKVGRPAPAELRSFPESWEFGYAPGGNAAYRVAALRAVGGFDERITYYLDETDVCLRLIDAGWMVATAQGAVMHHKSLPSAVRNERRAVVDWTQIVRSRVYFARRHATPVLGEPAVDTAIGRVLDEHRAQVERDAAEGRLGDTDRDAALWSIEAGASAGEQLAALGPVLGRIGDAPPPQFLPFCCAGGAGHRRVVALTRSPLDAGSAGPPSPLEVRLITPGRVEFATVDLVGDVWLHRTPAGRLHDELDRVLATMDVAMIVSDLDDPIADASVDIVRVDDVAAWLRGYNTTSIVAAEQSTSTTDATS